MTAGLTFGCAVLGVFYLAGWSEALDMFGAHAEVGRLLLMLVAMITTFKLIRQSLSLSNIKADEAVSSGLAGHLAGSGLFTFAGQALTVTGYSYLCLSLYPELELCRFWRQLLWLFFLRLYPVSQRLGVAGVCHLCLWPDWY